MKAVIVAAGLGSRFLPATKAVPKEMLPVLDKPVIQYIVEEAVYAGADEVIIVTNKNKGAIKEQFTPNLALEAHLRAKGKDALADAVVCAGSLPVTYVYQEEPAGLGHAVLCARRALADEPFMLMLGDALVVNAELLPSMLKLYHAQHQASVIAVVRVSRDEVERFGIVAGTDLGSGVLQLESMVEKPKPAKAPSNLAIFGRYILTPAIMDILADTQPGAGGEIQLTDALVTLLAREKIYALEFEASQGLDTGTPEAWLAANIALARQDPRFAGCFGLS